MVLSLHVQVTQLAGTHGVVLGIELVEALEGLSALMTEVGRRFGKEQQKPDPMYFFLIICEQLIGFP